MADYTVISAVSASLKKLLEDGITFDADPQLHNVPIHLLSPKEMRESLDKKTGVSLWLYRVVRNGDRLNVPPRRPAPNQVARQPLPLDLHYLVTPIVDKPEDEQALLGRAVQVFNDNAILRGTALQGVLGGSGEELRLALETPALEELARVWQALMESYQLSISYLVQLVSIDSAREPLQAGPVLVREATYTQIVEAS